MKIIGQNELTLQTAGGVSGASAPISNDTAWATTVSRHLQTGTPLYFANGDWRVDTPQYFYVPTTDTLSKLKQHRLTGDTMARSRIVVGAAIGANPAFTINRDSSGNFGHFDRYFGLKVEDLALFVPSAEYQGQTCFFVAGATDGGAPAISLSHVRIEGFFTGIVATGYADFTTADHVIFGNFKDHPTTGEKGWAFKGSFLGDGNRFASCKFDASPTHHNGVFLRNAAGSVFDACIYGNHRLEGCTGFVDIGGHYETTPVGRELWTTCSTKAHFVGTIYQQNETPSAGTLALHLIDDSLSAYAHGSEITFQQCSFKKIVKKSTGSTYAPTPDIYIKGPKSSTVIRLRGSSGISYPSGKQEEQTHGLVIRSDDAALDAVLTGPKRAFLGGDVDILNRTGIGWDIVPVAGGVHRVEADLGDFSPPIATNPDTGFLYTERWTAAPAPAAGGHFYAAQTFHPVGAWQGFGATEYSCTTDGGNQPVITITARLLPCLVRIFHSPVTGVAANNDRWCDVLLTRRVTTLHDFGVSLGGFPWISGNQAPVTNGTLTIGRYLAVIDAFGSVELSGTPPTSGQWAFGTRCRATAYDAARPVLRWQCYTAGTPGLWRQVEHVQLSGTTAQRPAGLGGYDVGVTYQDTTLSKLIRWSGTGWVDNVTGAAA